MLGEQEQNDYNDVVKLLEYGDPKTESEEEAADLDPSPSKEPQKRVRTEETPAAPEVATTPPRAPEWTQTSREVPEASGSGNRTIDPPEDIHLSGNVDEDIIELLRNAALRSAYRTQQYGSLVNYLLEIQKEIGLEDVDNIVNRIRSLRQTEVKMQILQEQ